MAIWNTLRTFGKFYDRLVHFVLIWYIFTVLVSRNKKNLATLQRSISAHASLSWRRYHQLIILLYFSPGIPFPFLGLPKGASAMSTRNPPYLTGLNNPTPCSAQS
jgi:hypothetical protein